DGAVIETADLRDADFPTARAVLLLDVLHYLPAAAQEELLARAVRALEPGGVLFIRDADAAAGWRFTATRIQERLATMARRQFRQRFHYRSTAEWRALLAAYGLEVSSEPMSMGTPYANVLIQARRPSL
ncbi:MAG TPA: class I SAM-dependent methyltransferase, partial [Thermoanaerobaculia bacterium]|nr:class I SAM-dependent methyltransferase [Thermoanaerobaculia bacterium]